MSTLKADLLRAVTVLRNGGVVAYPTDTLYGLAVDPRSARAVARLLEVKQREQGHAIPLIAANFQQAQEAAIFDEAADRVAGSFWPGPLSIVLPARDVIRPELRAADGSVAVRVAAHPVSQSLAGGLGFCITATSANRSGDAPTNSPTVVARTIGNRIDFLLNDGESPGGAPSTIVDLRNAQPRLVREGAIAWERVLRSIE